MPQWLTNQLSRAFLSKDRKQIKLLNDCWFYYHQSIAIEKEELSQQ